MRRAPADGIRGRRVAREPQRLAAAAAPIHLLLSERAGAAWLLVIGLDVGGPDTRRSEPSSSAGASLVGLVGGQLAISDAYQGHQVGSNGHRFGLSLLIDAASRRRRSPDLVVHRAEVRRDELAVVGLARGGQSFQPVTEPRHRAVPHRHPAGKWSIVKLRIA
jgi:hypothetical protein